MTDTPDVQDITVAIMEGTFDGSLGDISKAIGHRILAGPGQMYWRLTYSVDDIDIDVSEEDLLVHEAELIEKLTDRPWSQIAPHQSAACAKAVLAVVLHTRGGKSMKAAGEIAGNVTALALTRCIDHYEVNPAPLD